MSYKLEYDDKEYRFRTKDELIWQLAVWLGGDGAVHMKLTYPDGWVLIE